MRKREKEEIPRIINMLASNIHRPANVVFITSIITEFSESITKVDSK
jgi:hypothetical protein